jgi:bifunctional enzyme Fae/Hps
MIYGPAQSALARAIVDALETERIPAEVVDNDIMVALTTVHPRALDRHALSKSVHAAAAKALEQAFTPSSSQGEGRGEGLGEE